MDIGFQQNTVEGNAVGNKEQRALIFWNPHPSIFFVFDHILYSRGTTPLKLCPRDSWASRNCYSGSGPGSCGLALLFLFYFTPYSFLELGNQILNKINYLSA